MDGPFRWLDGSKWDFTNWDDGEPDRKSPGRSHHECVQSLLLSLTFCCVLNVVVVVVVVDVFRYWKCCSNCQYDKSVGAYSWGKTQRTLGNGKT